MGYEHIEVERDEAISIVRLNRPERLNAIDPRLKSELIAALDEAEADDGIRVVILAGKGRAFSAGADLGRLADRDRVTSVVHARERIRTTEQVAGRLWSFGKPIIAAVHGYCLGVACELALLCDLTIAAEGCKIGEPEIRFGSASPILAMPWLVPMKVARELLLSGATISAERAYEVGMVNEVVPADQLEARALRRARLLARISPLALRLTKEGLARTYELMGIRSAIAQHAHLAATIDGTATEESAAFAEIVKREGVKAAVRWRDAQFRELESEV